MTTVHMLSPAAGPCNTRLTPDLMHLSVSSMHSSIVSLHSVFILHSILLHPVCTRCCFCIDA